MTNPDATLPEMLEQNRQNLKALLKALDADDSVLEDPEKKARRKEFFTGVETKGSDMSEEERIAWLFESSTKAIADAAKAAGVPKRKLSTEATDPVKNSNFTLKPKEADRRQAQREKNREEKKADVDTSGFLDPRGE